MKKIFISFFTLFFLSASAQNDITLKSFPKHKIWLYTSQGNMLKGVLVSTSDSSVNIFPGKFSEWNSHPKTTAINESYLNINNIKTHKKGGLIKGMLIGAGIGLAPVLLSSAFGQGEGGAYVSIITFPIGIITGAIIGSTSKKKFFIDGDASRFHSFHKRIKY